MDYACQILLREDKMISIPTELYDNIMITVGNQLALTDVPRKDLDKLISEILRSWELFNKESDLYVRSKKNILFGYTKMNEYKNRIVN